MYSQFPSDDEAAQRASDMRFFKGIAVGFGAGLLLATIVNSAFLPTAAPDTGAAEPSSLIAWPTAPFSMAAQSNTAPLRGAVVSHGGRGIKDGLFMPKQGTGDSGSSQQLYQPAQYRQPTSAQPAPGQYSEEQLEFLRRTGKAPAVQPQSQQPVSAQPAAGQYSAEQLAFLQRTGKVPGGQPQYQPPTPARSAQTSWGSSYAARPASQQSQSSGTYGGSFHNQKFCAEHPSEC